MKPTEFWEWDEVDKAYTIAFIKAKSMIQGWENQVQEDDAKRAARRGNSSGRKFRGRR